MHIKLGENTRITAHDVKGDLPTSEANRKSLSVDAVKRLFQVNETDVQRCVPLFALFQNLAQSEDVIRAGSLRAETCLLWSEVLLKDCCQS